MTEYERARKILEKVTTRMTDLQPFAWLDQTGDQSWGHLYETTFLELGTVVDGTRQVEVVETDRKGNNRIEVKDVPRHYPWVEVRTVMRVVLEDDLDEYTTIEMHVREARIEDYRTKDENGQEVRTVSLNSYDVYNRELEPEKFYTVTGQELDLEKPHSQKFE